ncbi:hypothetical protein R3P38DRAFT_3215776 [Favolaschia claudopus]|uniref:RNase H type-1 domain-containing protein n=1 Tax=Favolaschia claudopus TaxID=2862362 RepID=A0AAW0A843_9AGAR
MEYGLPVWYKPVVEREGSRRAGAVWVAKALGNVQRQACKLITGALRTTATDVLDFHANLLPVHIRLNRSAYNAALVLRLSPPPTLSDVPSYAVAAPLASTAPHYIISSTRSPSSDPTSRQSTLAEDSSPSRQAQSRLTSRRPKTMLVRTWRGWWREEEHAYSLMDQASRTALEQRRLALDIIADIPRLTDVDIFLDCQPAIIAHSSSKPQPGQYLLATFHAVLGRLQRTRRTLRIRLRWVPAHVGIAGNDSRVGRCPGKGGCARRIQAPQVADKALRVPTTTSRAAVIADGAKVFAKKWIVEWKTSPRYTRIASFDSPTPSNATSRMYKNLSRPQCSIITQLRTGHIGLNAYLFRFHLAPSPFCPHCNALESVPHLLLSCPAYRAQRLRLFIRLGTARVSLRRLLSSKHDPAPVLAFILS